jgi:hypothetical protein
MPTIIAPTIADAARGMSGLKPWSPPRRDTVTPTNDPIFAAIQGHRDAHRAKVLRYAQADRLIEDGQSIDYDKYTEDQYDDGWKALEDFSKTVPTTVPGLFAMLTYIPEITASNYEGFLSESGLDKTLVKTLASAAKTLQTSIDQKAQPGRGWLHMR